MRIGGPFLMIIDIMNWMVFEDSFTSKKFIEFLRRLVRQIKQKVFLIVDNQKRKLEKNKGYLCSINGNKYEKRIYDITKHTSIYGKPFNTQKEKDLAGSSSKNDLECNFISKKR